MASIQLVYEPAAGSTIPSLQPVAGSLFPGNERQLADLERQVRNHFNDYARGTLKTLQFQDRTLSVTAQGDQRMPRLLIQEAGLVPLEPAQPSPGKPGWLDAFLAEFHQALADPGCRLDSLERNQLEFVLAEFRDKAGRRDSLDLAFVLMASCIGSMEQTFRANDSSRANVYSVALRALEKLLPVGECEHRTTVAFGTAPPDGFVRKALRRLFGV